MNIYKLFEYSGNSIIGDSHRINDISNQDAFYSIHNPNHFVAVIADGCTGASGYSEVGARIGSQLIATEISAQYELLYNINGYDPSLFPDFWQLSLRNILEKLERITKTYSTNYRHTLTSDYLFTVLGVLMTNHKTYVFNIGDGEYFLNGERHIIEAEVENTPDYISYNLLAGNNNIIHPFKVQEKIDTVEIDSLMIASDGISYFVDNAENTYPNGRGKVGDVSQFWTDDSYFENPDAIRRKLAMVNKPHKKVGGLLKDDTTLFTIRRKATE